MNKTSIQDEIRLARKRKGMTQQELANLAGISLRTLQRVENGAAEVSGYSLKQISQVLNIPLENLIMPNVESITIETNSTESIKKLYWLTLLGIVHPLLAFVVPAVVGRRQLGNDTLYRKHYRFILIFQGVISAIYILFWLGLIILFIWSDTNMIGTPEVILVVIALIPPVHGLVFATNLVLALVKGAELNRVYSSLQQTH